MEIYLVRHGIAGEVDADQWPDDSQRPLTAKGARRLKKAAAGIKQIVPRVDVLVSSRYARAWRTAEILASEAGWPAPIELPSLEPGHTPADVLVGLSEKAGVQAVALVGHEPNMHELLAYLVIGPEASGSILFKKGGVACISIDGEPRVGGGTLEWLATPKILRALA